MTRFKKSLHLSSALVRPAAPFGLALGLTVGLAALLAPGPLEGLAMADPAVVTRSGQDNIRYDRGTGSDIEKLIYQFGGPREADADRAGGETVDPEIERLHGVADEINAAYDASDFDTLHTLLADNPAVRPLRPEVNLLEAWAFHKAGQPGKAHNLFMALYESDPSVENAAGVIYSGMASAFYSRTIAFAEAQGGVLADILKPWAAFPQVDETPSDTLRRQFHENWVDAALRYNKTDTAKKVAALLGLKDLGARENALALGEAWKAYDDGKDTLAAALFTHVLGASPTEAEANDALLGYGLVLKREGALDDAQRLIAPRVDADPRLAQLSNDLTLEQAYKAFEAEDFERSLALSITLEDSNKARAAGLLKGWSLFKLGRFAEAATVFERLYREAPGQESADGALASLLATGERARLMQLANDVDGPLEVPEETSGSDGVWVMPEADAALYRGDYALASASHEEVRQTLQSWAGVGLSFLHRDGDDGLGKLDMIGSKASLAMTNETIHVRADLEVLHLDAGGPPASLLLTGSRPSGPRPYAPTWEETVFKPSFFFRKEGEWGYEASLGTSPLDGEVSPAILGHFDAIHHRKGARYAVGAHRGGVYESLLSVSGLQDTVSGEGYGRVVETGLHASVYQPVAKNWALTGEAKIAERDGKNVASNQMSSFAVGAVYSFSPEGFSYLAVGPSFRAQQFDKNLSFYTFGHGGYYSPQDLSNVSLNLAFLTEENRAWVARGTLSAGYEDASSDEAPFYPLDPQPGDPVYLGSETNGMAFSGEFALARRLSDLVIGEMGAYGIDTEGYSEYGLYAKLRVTFGTRDAVFRTDLTEPLHRLYH